MNFVQEQLLSGIKVIRTQRKIEMYDASCTNQQQKAKSNLKHSRQIAGK